MRFPRRFLAVPAFAVLMLVATPFCQSAVADDDGDIDENIQPRTPSGPKFIGVVAHGSAARSVSPVAGV